MVELRRGGGGGGGVSSGLEGGRRAALDNNGQRSSTINHCHYRSHLVRAVTCRIRRHGPRVRIDRGTVARVLTDVSAAAAAVAADDGRMDRDMDTRERENKTTAS